MSINATVEYAGDTSGSSPGASNVSDLTKAAILSNINAAIAAWDSVLGGSATLRISVVFNPNVRGDFRSFPSNILQSIASVGDVPVYEPVFSHELRTGYKNTAVTQDFTLQINPNIIDKFYVDENIFDNNVFITQDRFDFYTEVLRDIGHILGFSNYTSLSGNRQNKDFIFRPDTLLTAKGGRDYYSGENIDWYNGGPLELGPANFQHYPVSLTRTTAPSSLMSGDQKAGVRGAIGAIDLAVLADLGIGTRQADILRIHTEDTGRSVTVDADAGTDTLVLAGARAEYQVHYSASKNAYSLNGKGFTDTLISIEALRFADQTVWIEEAANISNGVHRFYNSATKTHFYTGSNTEAYAIRSQLVQANDEGFAFANASAANALAVYRFQNTQNGSHFYTISPEERDNIQKTLPQYAFEGTSFKAYVADSGPQEELYRFYNTATGAHFFTTSEAERDTVLTNFPSYRYEGVGFYVDILS